MIGHKARGGHLHADVCDRLCSISASPFFTAKTKRKFVANCIFPPTSRKNGEQLVSHYRSRFQVELLYRDAKQHCGFNDCQARSKSKLHFHFHFNAALTAVNVAKIRRLTARKSETEPFSTHNFNVLMHNKLLSERFFRAFAINPNLPKNRKHVEELYGYGLIAA